MSSSPSNPPRRPIAKDRVVPAVQGVVLAGQLHREDPACASWGLEALAGRLVEVSGTGPSASLTMTVRVLLEAQRHGEPAAWISAQPTIFFPPDLVASGIDLAALPVIRVAKAFQVARAAETLLRSGGFSLVILDLGTQQSMTLAVQTRLAGLARRDRAAILALTRKTPQRPSLGSLVAVRADCRRHRVSARDFDCELRILKDKRSGRGRAPAMRQRIDRCQGPDGVG